MLLADGRGFSQALSRGHDLFTLSNMLESLLAGSNCFIDFSCEIVAACVNCLIPLSASLSLDFSFRVVRTSV